MGILSWFSLDCTANWGKESTINESISLFNKAQKSIKIVAGRLDNAFYKDEKTINTLKRAIDRGVSVDVVYYPSEKNKEYKAVFVNNIPNAHLTSIKQKPSRHWVSVDSKHVRIERSHPEETINTPAFICNNASILAEELDKKFEKLVQT